MSFLGCFMHGQSCLLGLVCLQKQIATKIPAICSERVLPWCWLEELKWAEWVRERLWGVCVFRAWVGSRRVSCKRGWCLGPGIICIFVMRKAISCWFSFYSLIPLTLFIQNDRWLVYCSGWIIAWRVRELKQKLLDHLIKAIFCLRRAFLSVNVVK